MEHEPKNKSIAGDSQAIVDALGSEPGHNVEVGVTDFIFPGVAKAIVESPKLVEGEVVDEKEK